MRVRVPPNRRATINGARTLGLGDSIGSIEVGKQADLIAVDLARLNTQPVYDPVAELVYAANSQQVSHVWIAGKCQLRDHRFANLDETSIIHNAQTWAQRIKKSQ